MLTQPSDPMWFVCGTQNFNDGNWFLLQNIWHICAQDQNYPVYDTPFLSTFVSSSVISICLYKKSMFALCIRKVLWICWAKLTPVVEVSDWITICMSCYFEPMQYTRYPSTASSSSLAVNDCTLDVRVTSDRPSTP